MRTRSGGGTNGGEELEEEKERKGRGNTGGRAVAQTGKESLDYGEDKDRESE